MKKFEAQSDSVGWSGWGGLLSPWLISDVFLDKGIESLNNILMRVWKRLLSYAVCELRKVTLQNFTVNVALERGEAISRLVIPILVPISLPRCGALCLTDCPGLAGGQGSAEWDRAHCGAGASQPIN